MTSTSQKPLIEQLRLYDPCFAEFLIPALNGQKHLQEILLRESFQEFSKQGIAIQKQGPTVILDVSCGRGDYSVAWISQISKFLSTGVTFYCTDFPGGVCIDTGESYTKATVRKVSEAAQAGRLKLIGEPIYVDANLFSGLDPIIPAGKKADIVHWSHSAYHVRDALGVNKDNVSAIEQGLNIAIDKIWSALKEDSLMLSIHATSDASDGLPGDMLFDRRPGNIPELISKRIKALDGYSAQVNFSTPLHFPAITDDQWKSLKIPAEWNDADSGAARVLRLLNFMTYDFSDPHKSGLERLFEEGRLSKDCLDYYKPIIKRNGGYINSKCAFQMVSRSKSIAEKLNTIAAKLKYEMSKYLQEMKEKMLEAYS